MFRSKLRLLDEKSTNKRKKCYTHLNSKRNIRRPTVSPANNGLYVDWQSLDKIERLSHAVHDAVDIFAAVKDKLESVTKELLFDGGCE
jgi:hypothetical protein